MSKPTIRLQGIGLVEAEPAGNVLAGDQIMFNYGITYTVVDVFRQTRKTIWLELVNENGRVFQIRRRKTTLVARRNMKSE